MKWTEKAPAKINLALDVLKRRPDGYHEVEMVMTTVDLADRIFLQSIPEDKIRIVSQNHFVPEDNRNLAYQAADLLKRQFNVQSGIEIEIEKVIPIAAGLAGGSSDAAATLRGLNHLWSLGLSLDELAELGAGIGSDVPFCVYGGTALSQGRGEKITYYPAPPNCWVILAKPNLGVSTADVYRGLDLSSVQHPDVSGMLQAIQAKDFMGICAKVGNVLEDVTFQMYPEVKRIKEQMARFGADAVLMSGSGPTVFALVEQESRMQRVYNGLKGFCAQVFAVRLLGNRVE